MALTGHKWRGFIPYQERDKGEEGTGGRHWATVSAQFVSLHRVGRDDAFLGQAGLELQPRRHLEEPEEGAVTVAWSREHVIIYMYIIIP